MNPIMQSATEMQELLKIVDGGAKQLQKDLGNQNEDLALKKDIFYSWSITGGDNLKLQIDGRLMLHV